MNNDNTTINAVSDDFHTMDELYHHRAMLFAVICNQNKHLAWKSKLHSDGTMYEDYFIAGIDTPNGQFTYHQKMIYWDLFKIPAIAHAPEWDGHTSKDVNRLMSLKACGLEIDPKKLMQTKVRPDMKNNTIKIDVTKFSYDELNNIILSYVRNGFYCWQEEIKGLLSSGDKRYLCINGAVIIEEEDKNEH